MAKTSLGNLNSIEQQALTQFVRQLQEEFNNLVQLVVLFGSRARGDDTPNSDIDVLVVVTSDDWRLHKQICYLAIDIGLKYDLLRISPHIWSTAELQKMEAMQTSLYHNIQQDGINLLEISASPFAPSLIR